MADPIICNKVRESLKGYILDAAVGILPIYDGRRSGDKELPCIICDASGAEEEPKDTGNFWVDAVVTFRYSAAVDATLNEGDPETVSLIIWRNLMTALGQSDLPVQLSSFADDFTCQGMGDVSIEEGTDEDAWVQTWKARLYCSPSDL